MDTFTHLILSLLIVSKLMVRKTASLLSNLSSACLRLLAATNNLLGLIRSENLWLQLFERFSGFTLTFTVSFSRRCIAYIRLSRTLAQFVLQLCCDQG